MTFSLGLFIKKGPLNVYTVKELWPYLRAYHLYTIPIKIGYIDYCVILPMQNVSGFLT